MKNKGDMRGLKALPTQVSGRIFCLKSSASFKRSLSLFCSLIISILYVFVGMANCYAGTGTLNDYNPYNSEAILDYTTKNSDLTLSGAPSGSVITKVKVYYEVRHTYPGDLDVWLTYYDGSWHDYFLYNYGDLGGTDNILETRDNLSAWNGASPNQTWYLAVRDNASGDVGYIDFFELWVDYEYNEAPTTPGTISSSNVTSTSARVSWGSSSDPDGDNITYYVEYKKDLALTWTSAGSTTATYKDISNLESGTVYDVRVKASDGLLNSDWCCGNYEDVITTNLIAAAVSIASVNPDPVIAGNSVTIYHTVTNTGNTASSFNVAVEIRQGSTTVNNVGGVKTYTTGSIDANSSYSGTAFNLSLPSGLVGTYTARVVVRSSSGDWLANHDKNFTVQAQFVDATVSITSINPDSVIAGNNVTIYHTVTNTGNTASNFNVAVEIRQGSTTVNNVGGVKTYTTGSIDANSSYSGTAFNLSLPSDLAGTYTARLVVRSSSGDWLANHDKNFTVQAPVIDATVSITSISPDPVEVGNTVTIDYTINNTSNVAQSFGVGAELRQGSTVIDPDPGYMSSSIAANSSYSGKFYYTIPSNLNSGTYTMRLSVWSGTPDSSTWLDSYDYTFTIANPDSAEIIAFSPPSGVLQRGDQTTTTVTIKNTGTSTRSFWVGLSFAPTTVSGSDWPTGWYDIYPIQTSDVLSPGEEETVTFNFDIPDWLPPGQIRADTAVWHDYNRDLHRMLPENLPPFDAKRGVTAFSLEGYVEATETIFDLFNHESKITKTWRGIEGDVWNKYLNQDKMLIFISVGAFEFVSGTMVIDAVDYLGITPEGQGSQEEHEWVTVWIDGGLGVPLYSLFPVVFGVKSHTFDDPATADVRQSITEEVGSLNILGRRFTFLTVENGKPQFFESNRNFETQISLEIISGSAEGFLRYEISRSRLNQIFKTALLSVNGTINLESSSSPVIQLFSEIKTVIDEGVDGLDFRIPGTDDDGNWKPDTPTNVTPADGAIGISNEPVLWGSPFSDFDCDLPICIPYASHWQIDDVNDFSSPIYDSDQQIGTSAELPTGWLEYNTQYFWRVQYKDSIGAWSNWSIPTSFQTTLLNQPLMPIIAPIEAQIWQEGSAYTSPTPSLSQGTQLITWSLVNPPSGMYIDSDTGVVSWLNPTSVGSPHAITIQATNSADFDDETWLLTVTTEAVIDTTPPIGSISINSSEAYTRSGSVNLSLYASDISGVSQICISNTTTCSSWESYTTSKSWTLPSGDGTRTIYVWFKDNYDNENSSPYTDSITLDSTAPIDGILTAAAQNTVVSLSWSAFSDSGSGLAISNIYKLVYSTAGYPASCAIGTEIYSGTDTSYIHKDLINGTTCYYRVCATDNAGNASTGANASATPVAPEGASVPPITTEGIYRTDGGNDANNLDTSTSNPKIDLEYDFRMVLKDSSGNPPQSVKLYMTDRSSPSAGDFYAYSLTCLGDISTGATCSYPTKLGPANAYKYYFEAVLADSTTARYPATGEITGPAVELLGGSSMAGVPRDIVSAFLDGNTGLGCTEVYRWVSDGLTTDSNKGGYQLVDFDTAPLKPGEGYFVKKDTCGTSSLLELDVYSDVTDDPYYITLKSGWNMISNPYGGNVLLSSVKVQKGSDTPITWADALTGGWLENAIYYYKGSDWGSTYFSENAGGTPDATLVPWLGYWIYLNKDDATYKLVVPRP